MTLIDEFKWRGLLNQCTDEVALAKHLADNQVTLYCGFDPTSDSLHVGNLIPMICLMRFKQHGHNPLALVGGATGLIGDPSGKNQERDMLLEDIVHRNSGFIENQIRWVTGVETVNNIDWTQNMSVIEFMRVVGKNFTVNSMLARDSVTSRLGGDGLSFTEFSYMLFQGNDFLQLAKQKGCTLQIGGSDQFGNICSGLDLLRKNNLEGFGMTFPLMVKSDGTKFGKSEKGTVWLSVEKTSPWEFFQFWLNVSDDDVVKLLKFFTFLDQDTINDLEEKTKSSPGLRLAQKALAVEVTTLIHGASVCESIKQVAELLFSGREFDLSDDGIELLKSIIPVSTKDVAVVHDIKSVLVETQLVGSITKATQAIKENAVLLFERNKPPVKVTETLEINAMKPLLVRKGKKSFALVV